MKLGVVFPQTEIGADPGGLRAYAEAAEALGYDYLLAYEHILGADPAHHSISRMIYTHESMFHEPFVLFGYLAAFTKRIELATGVVVSPLRETALLAKQAAEVDVLTGGRLRLGIGVGWNPVEYEAVGYDQHTRGARQAEQIELMRLLWTRRVVTFKGKFHSITAAGLNPMPIQRPIPIWIGGSADNALRRAAKLADGYIPGTEGDPTPARNNTRLFLQYAKEAGRDLSRLGVDSGVALKNASIERCADDLVERKAWGATHLRFNSMGGGLSGPQQHIDAIRKFRELMKARGM